VRVKLTLVLLLAASSAFGAQARTIAPHVTVVEGPVNGVLIRQDGAAIAIYGDPGPRPAAVERVLFTHHRRDAAWAGRAQVEAGAEAVVPAAEEALFSGVRAFWDKYRAGRFGDYSQQSSRILTVPVAAAKPVRGGDRIAWKGIGIEVLDTPGYTRGAVSYLFEAGGKRIACTGDLIWGDGRILDLFSLQDAIAETKEDGYHGWAARAADVIASLHRVAAWNPGLLVPARGPVIDHPKEAIDRLTARLQAAFASHFEIDALRWYRGDDKIRTQAARVMGGKTIDWMPTVETVPKPPEWIVPISNSRLIVSRDGPAFLVDCGSRRILDEVKRTGRKVEGIWVTHYHNDHTEFVERAAEELQCPVYATAELRDILEHTERYRMPAQTANAIGRVETPAEGSSRRWHEYEFRYFYFPGQTLYHDALLVKRDGGEAILFVGDSFTPTGIDDYCLLNRNYFRRGQGFLYCLDLMRRLKFDWMINQHVLPMFRFNPAEMERMERNLEARIHVLEPLFPFDDANYCTDEQWMRLYPYAVDARAGATVELQAVILNHARVRREYRILPQLPAGWKTGAAALKVTLAAGEERSVAVPVAIPAGTAGTHVVTAGVAFGRHELREWAEAIVTVR